MMGNLVRLYADGGVESYAVATMVQHSAIMVLLRRGHIRGGEEYGVASASKVTL